MGKITGFLEYERENGKALPPKERIKTGMNSTFR